MIVKGICKLTKSSSLTGCCPVRISLLFAITNEGMHVLSFWPAVVVGVS